MYLSPSPSVERDRGRLADLEDRASVLGLRTATVITVDGCRHTAAVTIPWASAKLICWYSEGTVVCCLRPLMTVWNGCYRHYSWVKIWNWASVWTQQSKNHFNHSTFDQLRPCSSLLVFLCSAHHTSATLPIWLYAHESHSKFPTPPYLSFKFHFRLLFHHC